uniref:Uncharacterized protein n=1 Tax=Anguilla anguilla TaxID=7936 RepID=A0A0E9R5I6_ANGAN
MVLPKRLVSPPCCPPTSQFRSRVPSPMKRKQCIMGLLALFLTHGDLAAVSARHERACVQSAFIPNIPNLVCGGLGGGTTSAFSLKSMLRTYAD